MSEELVETESAAKAALLSLYPQVEEQLNLYVDILAGRGIEWGLLGPGEGDKLWRRHVANSLVLSDVVAEGVDIADVGSGAGLPGLPLAIVRPDLRVTLIEPLQRRSEFLTLAIEELELDDRVRLLRGRAEELGRGKEREVFDVVTARAVAPLGKLLGWTSELFLPHGELVALKGQSAEAEIRKAAKVLRGLKAQAEVLELSVSPAVEGTRAIRVRR